MSDATKPTADSTPEPLPLTPTAPTPTPVPGRFSPKLKLGLGAIGGLATIVGGILGIQIAFKPTARVQAEPPPLTVGEPILEPIKPTPSLTPPSLTPSTPITPPPITPVSFAEVPIVPLPAIPPKPMDIPAIPDIAPLTITPPPIAPIAHVPAPLDIPPIKLDLSPPTPIKHDAPVPIKIDLPTPIKHEPTPIKHDLAPLDVPPPPAPISKHEPVPIKIEEAPIVVTPKPVFKPSPESIPLEPLPEPTVPRPTLTIKPHTPTFEPETPKPVEREPIVVTPAKPKDDTTYDEDMHQIRTGDTYRTISRTYYNAESYAGALQKYNEAHRAPQAEYIRVPPIWVLEKRYPTNDGAKAVTYQPSTAESPVVRTGGTREYVVPEAGEMLADVAQKALGNEQSWNRIYDLNRTINPAKKLPGGTRLMLPDR